MLLDEIRQLLRELADEVGAVRTSVMRGPGEPTAPHIRVTPLGSGSYLRVEMATAEAPEGLADGRPSARPAARPDDIQLAATMTRYVRALRACARRWECHQVPECSQSSTATPPTDRVRERIRGYLTALANAHQADLVVVAIGLDIIAASAPMDELVTDRLPFIIRRIDVEAENRQRSHAELIGPDFYGVSFWFSACLVAFFSAPYSEDFVRHRARLVTRELVPLLSMLDEPPPSPVQVAPLPE